MIVHDTILLYPNPNLPFIIEINASNYQLVSVIKQQFSPVHPPQLISFYSRKLNPAQHNYTTIEKELLSVIEILKEFQQLLFGAKFIFHTDHKNLMHQITTFTTQQVLHWRILIQEYNPTFVYLPGKFNYLTDALSCIHTMASSSSVEENDNKNKIIPNLIQNCYQKGQVKDLLAMPKHKVLHAVQSIKDQINPNENYLSYPVFDNYLGHCDFTTIQMYQQEDKKLLQAVKTSSKLFFNKIRNCSHICIGNKEKWKVVLTDSLLPKIIK